MARGHLVRTGLSYVGFAGVIGVGSAFLFPRFDTPGWLTVTVFALLALGLPIVLYSGWILEDTEPRRRLSSVRPEPVGPELLAMTRALDESDGPPPTRAPTGDPKTVAVLPFAYDPEMPDEPYFMQGFAEDLIDRLSHVRGLTVISGNSTLPLRNKDLGDRETGSALGAGTLLRGVVGRGADGLRVHVDLVDATTGDVIWSESYERPLDDLFAVQAEITMSTASVLGAAVTSLGAIRIRRRPTLELQAQEQYYRAREAWASEDPEAPIRTQALLLGVLELDENHAAAQAGLAMVLLGGSDGTRSPLPFAGAMEGARERAERAIGLDPTLGWGYAVLALVHAWYDWDLNRAEDAARHGVDVDMNSAFARGSYADVQSMLGRAEAAVDATERHLEIDPQSTVALMQASRRCCHAGQIARGLELSEAVHRLDPGGVRGASAMAYTKLCQGDAEAALRWIGPHRAHLSGTAFAPVLAYALAREGDMSGYEEILKALEARARAGVGGWSEVALARLGAGDEAGAGRDIGEAASQARPSSNHFARNWASPLFESLRDDVRFKEAVDLLVMS